MKKLYRKSTVHPTLQPVQSDHNNLLSFLPAAILTLTVALSVEEREVLAYLISCSSAASFSGNYNRKTTSQKSAAIDHSPCFNCNCFRCYMSYWVKWDVSPNRQLIHEIIDAFEDNLLKQSKKDKNKKERRKGSNKNVGKVNAVNLGIDEPPPKINCELNLINEDVSFIVVESNSVKEETGVGEMDDDEEDNVYEEEILEKGSVRRFMSFVGERIWSVWG